MALPDIVARAKIPEPVDEVLRRLRERGFQAYLVGGCVRDLLLGSAPKDYDIATSARPEEVQASFRKVIPTGVQHGTVTVLSRGTPVEVTTFRKEGAYLDGRRPSSVTFHTEIAEDLSRRDFTINAIALDPVGEELVDPFGGQADLEARRIRCVGSAQERFGEDGLRPLRAVRFAAVLGFELDSATHDAIAGALGSFRKISAERIREEFSKLLLSSRPVLGLELLRSTGLLDQFLPEVREPDWQRRLARVAAMPTDLAIRLAALIWGAIAGAEVPGVLLRLKLPNEVIDRAALLVSEAESFQRAVAGSDADVRRFASRVGLPAIDPFLVLTGSPARERVERILAAQPPLTAKELALKGKDIMRILVIGPSPRVGEATRFLLEQVLENPALNTTETLSELLRKWADRRGS